MQFAPLSHLVLLCCSEVIQTYTHWQTKQNKTSIQSDPACDKSGPNVLRSQMFAHFSQLDLNGIKSEQKNKNKKTRTSFAGNGVRLWGAVQCFLHRKEVMPYGRIEISWCQSHIAALPLKLHTGLLQTPAGMKRIFTNNAWNLHTLTPFCFLFNPSTKVLHLHPNLTKVVVLKKSDHLPNQITCRCHANLSPWQIVFISNCYLRICAPAVMLCTSRGCHKLCSTP